MPTRYLGEISENMSVFIWVFCKSNCIMYYEWQLDFWKKKVKIKNV